LFIGSNTPANVQVDHGAVVGRTWSVIQVPQPNDMLATHFVRVSAEGHQDTVLEVRLSAGQVERIEVTLNKLSEHVGPGSASATP
jgi:hypothetical protein